MESIEDITKKIADLVVRARWIMDEYNLLFTENDEVIDLLNKSGSSFFILVKVEFEEGLILKLAKLTDPHQQGRNKNLSLEYLLKYAEDHSWSVREEMKAIFDSEITPNREAISEFRNKHLAHLDFKKSLDGSIDFPELSSINDLLVGVESIARLAYAEVHSGHRLFEIFLQDGAGLVVNQLHNGYIYKNLCDDRDDASLWYTEQERYGHSAKKIQG